VSERSQHRHGIAEAMAGSAICTRIPWIALWTSSIWPWRSRQRHSRSEARRPRCWGKLQLKS